VLRNLAFAVAAVALLASCARGADSGGTATTSTPDIRSPVSTSIQPSTTTHTTSSTTTVPATTTTTLSHEFVIWSAPADGQWFTELPIPWVYSVEPSDNGPPPDPVPGSMGWTRDEAVVTVNGHPTASELCSDCMYQRGRLWIWRAAAGEGDPYDFEPGSHSVVFQATFIDGVVVERSRTFHFEPALDRLTGWMVALDPDERTITFAAAAHDPTEDDGATVGPVTSVIVYPVREDAASILLGVDSGGQPPLSTIGFEDFADLAMRAQAGDCTDCFSGAWAGALFSPADSEPGATSFFAASLRDGEIQQLEQIWSP
jgi:hypothetical protein